MTSINVCTSVISHVFPFADILFETPLLPLFICLWFDIWCLLLLSQVTVSFFAFITGIRCHTGIAKLQFSFHHFQKWNQCPYIISVLKNICHYDILTIHRYLNVISRLQLGIPHMVILHVHEGRIRVGFTVIISSLKTCRMPVIHRLAF